MTIRGLAALEATLQSHASARKPLARWIELTGLVRWKDIVEARRHWPSADAIKGTNLTCFNIGGNNYRLLTVVRYNIAEVEIRELLTHAQYSRKYRR